MMKNRMPEIRFKEFNGEWEEKRLGDFIIQKSIKNKNNKYMASDCPLAGKHLKQLETDTNITNDEALHPIELMAKSYKL